MQCYMYWAQNKGFWDIPILILGMFGITKAEDIFSCFQQQLLVCSLYLYIWLNFSLSDHRTMWQTFFLSDLWVAHNRKYWKSSMNSYSSLLGYLLLPLDYIAFLHYKMALTFPVRKQCTKLVTAHKVVCTH